MGTDFILWDHDGVLVDTEPVFFQATRRTLRAYGVHLSREHWARCQSGGLGLAHVVGTERAPRLDLAQVRRTRDDLYEELLGEADVWIPGAAEVVADLAHDFRMALVTTSLRRFVDQLHGGTAALDPFEHIVTADDCSRHKPHPEPYLRAMELLSAPAARTVAVEDSPRGLTSAVRAGVNCVVVSSEFMQGSDFSQAHAFVEDLSDLRALLSSDERDPS